MLHESNLVHVAIFIGAFFLLEQFARNTRIKRMRSISSLIQLTVVLFCVDLLAGFFLIERLYDSSISASWMSKALYAYPLMLLIAIWRVFRHHKRARQTPPP